MDESRRINQLIRAANEGDEEQFIDPPLTEEERKHFEEMVKGLEEDRKKNPGVPIYYDSVELEW